MRAPIISLFVLSLLAALPQNSNQQTLHSGQDSSLRGLAASSDGKILWATGSNGVILRSPDAGKTWTRLHIDNAESADFRGVQSFGTDVAYVFSVGNDNKSHVYKTADAGKTWRTQYSDARPAFFLDGLVCRTENGDYWAEFPKTTEPAALPTEGVFAASNSSLILCGPNKSDILFATGGPAARVFHSADNAKTWTAVSTPILHGTASAGIFSISCSGKTIVAVGGDYRDPTATKSVAAYSNDFGTTWLLADLPPTGFRSAVTYVANAQPIAQSGAIVGVGIVGS